MSLSGYKELVEDYRLIETSDKTTGTRAYYKDSSGTARLPLVGDEWSSTKRNVLCRRRSHTKFFPDPNDRSTWIEKIVCEFSSSPLGAETRDTAPDAVENRRFQLGAEIQSIDEPSNWYWWENAGVTPKTDKVDQPMFLSNVMGTFTRQRVLTSDSQKDKWVQEKLEGQAGTINDREWEGFRRGSVLFNGISGGTQVDVDGNRVWVFECEFTFRIIRSGGEFVTENGKKYPADYSGAAIKEYDWLYVWRKNASSSGKGAWDRPYDDITQGDGDFLYAESDLENIFR